MSRMKATQINLRVAEGTAADLDVLAEHDHASRVDVARRILLDGIAAEKRNLGVRLYREGKVSKSRAAEIAGVSLWEMMEVLDAADARAEYSVSEAVEDIRRMLADTKV